MMKNLDITLNSLFPDRYLGQTVTFHIPDVARSSEGKEYYQPGFYFSSLTRENIESIKATYASLRLADFVQVTITEAKQIEVFLFSYKKHKTDC